jgi:hypothetical protein
MRILVASASGANGNGYGAVLSFGAEGEFLGSFSSDRRLPGHPPVAGRRTVLTHPQST